MSDKKTTEKPKSKFSDEQIEEWKRKHGEIKLIPVVDKDDASKKYECIVKKRPDRKTIEQALRFTESNMFKCCDILLKGIWIAGDDIIKDDPTYVLAAGGACMGLLNTAEAELVDL